MEDRFIRISIIIAETEGNTASPVTISGLPWIWYSSDDTIRRLVHVFIWMNLSSIEDFNNFTSYLVCFRYSRNVTEAAHSEAPCFVLAIVEPAVNRQVTVDDFYVEWRQCEPSPGTSKGGVICLNEPGSNFIELTSWSMVGLTTTLVFFISLSAPKYYAWTEWSNDRTYDCDSQHRFQFFKECQEYYGDDALTKTSSTPGHCKGTTVDDKIYEQREVNCIYSEFCKYI